MRSSVLYPGKWVKWVESFCDLDIMGNCKTLKRLLASLEDYEKALSDHPRESDMIPLVINKTAEWQGFQDLQGCIVHMWAYTSLSQYTPAWRLSVEGVTIIMGGWCDEWQVIS